MGVINAGLLGILQGLTEFLPVSSSGHLVLAQSFIPGFTQPGVLFDVILHLGTTVAVVIYFRNDIFSISRKTVFALIIGTIPAGIVGLAFHSEIVGLFEDVKLVGLALLVTAFMNFWTDKLEGRRQAVDKLDGLLVGIGQAFAIIPGVSRSGATIFTGSFQGLKRREAAEFSFLLSIPAILGASFLELFTQGTSNHLPIFVYLAGFISAFISGLFAISLVLRLLSEGRFKYFAIYCAVVGIFVLII